LFFSPFKEGNGCYFRYIMKEIYQHWKDCFFTETLLVGVLVTALIISIRDRKKHLSLRFFPFYFSCLLIVFLSLYVNMYSKEVITYSLTKFNFHHYIDYFSTLIELLIFVHFFTQVIEDRLFKKILIAITALFILYYFIELYFDKRFSRSISETTQSRVYTIESLILLIPCFAYFYELFKKPPILNLRQEPAFWTISGLSFFITCTLPYSLLENYLRNNYLYLMTTLYSVFYIFYILLLLMIIKAYSCSPKKSI